MFYNSTRIISCVIYIWNHKRTKKKCQLFTDVHHCTTFAVTLPTHRTPNQCRKQYSTASSTSKNYQDRDLSKLTCRSTYCLGKFRQQKKNQKSSASRGILKTPASLTIILKNIDTSFAVISTIFAVFFSLENVS